MDCTTEHDLPLTFRSKKRTNDAHKTGLPEKEKKNKVSQSEKQGELC